MMFLVKTQRSKVESGYCLLVWCISPLNFVINNDVTVSKMKDKKNNCWITPTEGLGFELTCNGPASSQGMTALMEEDFLNIQIGVTFLQSLYVVSGYKEVQFSSLPEFPHKKFSPKLSLALRVS